MARSLDGAPAHRVVTSSGRLAPGWEREQAELLRAEGVRGLARPRARADPVVGGAAATGEMS